MANVPQTALIFLRTSSRNS